MGLHLFCGYDKRESIGFHVFVSSVLERASVPVAIHVLDSKGLPEGSNSFTFSRFLVPWLLSFEGHAIFADASDMLMLADIAELDALFDPNFAVQVVQHNYKTRHPIKYRGTDMQCPNRDYPRKNWASLMLVNAEHPAWAGVTPDSIRASKGLDQLQFKSFSPDEIGALPDEWNRIVDEGHPVEGAKVCHWTAGIPAFKAYADAPGAALWFAQRDLMTEAV